MLTPVPPSDCMRAHEAVSARLDGELSQLGRVRLDAHLRACPDCRAFAADAAEISGLLRGAELEQPAAAVIPLRRRRTGALRIQVAAGAVAVAAAVAVVGLGLGHALRSPAPTPLGTAASIGALRDDSAQQYLLTFFVPQEPQRIKPGEVVAL